MKNLETSHHPELHSEKPARDQRIAKKRRLRGTSTRRRIGGQLHYFCDLAQALYLDSRSQKKTDIIVEGDIALYRAGQAK